MPERDLSWLEDDGGADDSGGEEEEDLDAAAAKLTADNEEAEGEEGAGADSGAQALLDWDPAADPDKVAADELFAEQSKQAEKLSRDYQPDAAPLTAVEEAAVKASTMSRDDLEFFTQQLRDAAAERRRALLANQPGYDDSGEPVVVEAPFDPSVLNSQDFNTFMQAVAQGGADPRKVPVGETYDSWRAKIDSALGAGVER